MEKPRIDGAERRKEMYILSLDNGRIFWILAISLLVLVFLFLLGYWIGHDGDKSTARGPADGKEKDMLSLKNELDKIGGARDGGPDDADGKESRDFRKDGKGERSEKSEKGDRSSRGDGDRDRDADKKDGDKATDKSRDKFRDRADQDEYESLRLGKADGKKDEKRSMSSSSSSSTRASKRTVGPVTSNAAGGRYAIQVASVNARGAADSLERELRKGNWRTFVSKTTLGGKEYWRVKVGGYPSYASARQALDKLRQNSLGKDSFIVTN